jgi:hypothetical protein
MGSGAGRRHPRGAGVARQAREERLRLMPGYVRRFLEKATPLVGLGIEGDLDGVFSLRTRKPFALDPLLAAMGTYPSEKRNRFSVRKPSDPETTVVKTPEYFVAGAAGTGAKSPSRAKTATGSGELPYNATSVLLVFVPAPTSVLRPANVPAVAQTKAE